MSEPKTPKPRPFGSERGLGPRSGPPARSTSQSTPKSSKDFAIVSGPTEDGQGARVLRIREGTVSAGEIRPVKDGEPITNNEVVRLHPIDAERRICEIEVLHSPALARSGGAAADRDANPDGAAREARGDDSAAQQRGSRHARVSTPNYRKNWSAIFEQKGKRGSKTDWSVN
jgi:hypothetical protein